MNGIEILKWNVHRTSCLRYIDWTCFVRTARSVRIWWPAYEDTGLCQGTGLDQGSCLHESRPTHVVSLQFHRYKQETDSATPNRPSSSASPTLPSVPIIFNAPWSLPRYGLCPFLHLWEFAIRIAFIVYPLMSIDTNFLPCYLVAHF